MAKERKSQFNIEELTAPNHGMKRDMGFFRAVGLMAGLMIGSGIFYVGAFVLDYVNLSTGMALLAGYRLAVLQGCPLNLADYLKQKIFVGSMGTTLEPREEDVRGFTTFLERYKAALQAERAAVEHF